MIERREPVAPDVEPRMDGDRIRTGVGIAVVFAVLSIAMTLSFATLVFGEATPEFLASGIAHFLLGAGVASILLSITSSVRGQLGGIQDVSAAIAGAIAASIATSLAGSSAEAVFANVLVALIAATLLTGLFFLLLGRFRLGNLVRFVPFPVMAGFLAATGWLLFKGGLEVSGGSHFEILEADYYLTHARLGQAALALTFGVGLYALTRWLEGELWVIPLAIVVGIAGFFLFVGLSNQTLGDFRQDDWLIGPLPSEPLWAALTLPNLELVEWDTIVGVAGGLLTFVLVSAIALMVTESGLEVALGRDIEVNDEMQRTGITNLLVSITGAPASWVEIPSTAAANSRRVLHWAFGVLPGAVLLLVFVAGPALISLFPRFIAGGLLIFLGLELMHRWLIESRKEMPAVDYVVVLAIVATVELLGFLPGVTVGLVASIIIFVVRYSSSETIRDQRDGGSVHSGTDRPIPDQRLLDYYNEQTVILQLQGFIFFGSAYNVYRSVKESVEDADTPPRFLLLDMRLVQGIDSSATATLIKMANFLRGFEAGLVVVPGTAMVRRSLLQAGLDPEHFEHLHVFEHFDEAIEWCEERVLETARQQLQQRVGEDADEDFLDAVFGDVMAALDVQEEFEDLVANLRPRMEVVDTPAGSTLFDQREENRRLFFIVSGRVSLERADFNGDQVRVRTLGRWNMVGQMGAFLGYREPFTARVEQDGEILALPASLIESFPAEEPDLAQRLQRLTIQMMGTELAKTAQTLAQP